MEKKFLETAKKYGKEIVVPAFIGMGATTAASEFWNNAEGFKACVRGTARSIDNFIFGGSTRDKK